MIFGVLKLKFDEDKAYSLSSQILTKSAKSARETSRFKEKSRRSIFALDEALLNLATGVTI